MTGKPEDILRLKYCPHCGYDIATLPEEHRCPECGYAYDAGTVCLEIAEKPLSNRLYLSLAIQILALAFVFILMKTLGEFMWIVFAYFSVTVLWNLYVGVQRFRFAKLSIPFRRLIITPHGYQLGRGLRIGKVKPWHPLHHVHIDDNGASYNILFISRKLLGRGASKLAKAVLIDAAQASALRKRIKKYIDNLETDAAGE